jgi:hypothetical protein
MKRPCRECAQLAVIIAIHRKADSPCGKSRNLAVERKTLQWISFFTEKLPSLAVDGKDLRRISRLCGVDAPAKPRKGRQKAGGSVPADPRDLPHRFSFGGAPTPRRLSPRN